MGVLDGPLGNVAQTLVGTFGRSATYTQPASGTYDPGNLDVIRGTATTTTLSVVFDDSMVKLFDEQMVEQGDRVGIIARSALGSNPDPGEDTLTETGNSVTWRVVAYRPYSSGAQEAAFALLLRR